MSKRRDLILRMLERNAFDTKEVKEFIGFTVGFTDLVDAISFRIEQKGVFPEGFDINSSDGMGILKEKTYRIVERREVASYTWSVILDEDYPKLADAVNVYFSRYYNTQALKGLTIDMQS